ncbi:MAG: TlpA family protein disulfide reductase, partial [Schwartzia sp.]|nr:TlpA family protein disulfide reductase [Schwartzia sp. (in: firmicutes)]
SNTTIHGLAGEKPVFLNFWATWCPYCTKEMPAIEELYKKYGGRLHFAAVSVDDENGAAAAFVQSRGLTVPVYTGALNKIGNDYNLDAIPKSVLVGTDGAIIAEHVGGMSAAELEAFLMKAL